jgi:hypothetical protein
MSAWTPVTEDTLKTPPTGWTPVNETKSIEKPGLLSRAWKWAAETPVLDNVLPKGITTKDLVRGVAFEKLFGEPYIPGANDFDTKAELHLGDTPTKAAVKTFLAGSIKDTADLGTSTTTPVGLATMALGPLSKVPGAIGTAAKVAIPAVSAGFAAKGVSDIATAGTENTPEAWQQRLIGGAQVVGGAAGLGESAKFSSARAARAEAARMAVSPLARKPPTATMEDINFGRGGGAGIANEGLVAGSRPSLVNKINTRLGELSDALDSQLQNHPNANAQIDVEPIIDKNIDAGIKAAKKLGDAGKETRLENLRTALKTEYGPLQGNPFEMNSLKRDIGEAGSDLGAFKHTDPNEASAAKVMGAIYSDIKAAVNAQVPEAAPLNQRMADLISDRMGVKRNIALNANKSPFSVIGPGHMAAKALEATVGSTPVRTGAARIMNLGNLKGLP